MKQNYVKYLHKKMKKYKNYFKIININILIIHLNIKDIVVIFFYDYNL